MKIDLTKFQIPNIDSWKNQVLKEANSDEALMYTNHIENIRIDISSKNNQKVFCLLYTSPSPRDKRQSRMPSSA